MMDQFRQAKRSQPDALLFFRMGDFYELFGDDAKVASRELGITLTSRDKGAEAMPMAGVPVRSLETHLMRLVGKGHKVAICEQLSDPRTTKGIVERDIVRVVTAGTITEENALDARRSNFLACLFVDGAHAGLSWVDLSTGRFHVTEVALDRIEDEVGRIGPAELLVVEGGLEGEDAYAGPLKQELGPRITEREPWRFERDGCRRALLRQFKLATLEGFGIEDESPIVSSAGALIEYVQETQRGTCDHIISLEHVDTSDHLVLDRATRSCLELTRTQREGTREGSLLETIDATCTPMGGRLMREWLLAPLRDVDAIVERQRAVAEFVEAPFLREEVRDLLRQVLDIERLVGKVSTGRANGRDLIGLRSSIATTRPLLEKLEAVYSKRLGDLSASIDPLDDLVERIGSTLVGLP